MNSNVPFPSQTPPDPPRGGRLPLRHAVIASVSMAVAYFAWQRTGGDYFITGLLLFLTAAVIDLRVGDSDTGRI
jgi:hypothetical protein